MATVILVRHGRTTANATGVLAGRTAGVTLDQVGQEQAALVGTRLAGIGLAGVLTSPMERCQQTAQHIVERQLKPTTPAIDPGITECDYGQWQGRQLSELATEKLWPRIQTQPSSVIFPGGESMAAMQARAVATIRHHDAVIEAEFGPQAVWVAVSHGDIIKSILADALGMHLDMFQRLSVSPASASIINFSDHRCSVLASNTEAGDLSWLAAGLSAADAPVGGGAGQSTPPSSGA